MDLGEQQMVQRSLLPPFGVTTPGLSPVPESAQRLGDGTGARTLELSAAASDDVVPHTAPIDGSAATRLGSIHRRGWGEAPTYLEAMSSPAFPPSDLEAGGVPPPRAAGNLRERTTSTFFGFFNRSSWRVTAPLRHSQAGSQASLLLQPQTSRLSARSYSTSGGAQSPWDSTQSLRISSPLPNSAVRASFEILPRAGLSEQQMRFISSSDALQTVGVSLADPPRRGRRRASSAATSAFFSDDPATPPVDEFGMEDSMGQGPPSWQAVDEERRRQEAEGRRGLAEPSQVAIEAAPESEREADEAASTALDGSRGDSGQTSQIANDSDRRQTPAEADAGSSATAGPPQLPQLDIPSGLAVPAPSLRLQPPTPVIP